MIVLPFRLLRADPEVDFLSFSLADAVTTSLSGLGSLVVRSSLTAAKFGAAAADLATIARDADVDAVLSGALLRAGSQLRLSAQLAEAPGGAVLWSHTLQVSLDDIFQLHDKLVHELVDALASSAHRARASAAGTRCAGQRQRPTSSTCAATRWGSSRAGGRWPSISTSSAWSDDPNYAPAWARLGRVYRLLAKYKDEAQEVNRRRAEEALNRALAINPDLSIAHNVLAQIEVDDGRATEAMVRLLRQAAHVRPIPDCSPASAMRVDTAGYSTPRSPRTRAAARSARDTPASSTPYVQRAISQRSGERGRRARPISRPWRWPSSAGSKKG